LFIYSNVPVRIADFFVSRAPNAGIAIIAILFMTGFISAFVENVATVLVMAPIAMALSKKLRLDPAFFMIGLAVMSNLQGTATLVGDPPAMIFATFAHYGFNDFFFFDGKPSIFFAVEIGMCAGLLFFYRYFAGLTSKDYAVEQAKVRSYLPSVLLILMIIVLALFSFLGNGISMTSGTVVVALSIAGLIWYAQVREPNDKRAFRVAIGIDWDTIAFLIVIFIVVGGISATGILSDLSFLLSRVIGNNVLAGFVVILIISVLLSGFIDNVPYIITMLPVAATLAKGLGLHSELYMFALLIGSCLGGNLTPFGASANIVAIGLLKKHERPVSFTEWLKIGVPFTLITTITASIFLWIVWR
jgi:Na+/H+ antiporter NhaD/arsenite permease-like protein